VSAPAKSVTLDIYSHILPGLQEAAAERFDKMLGANVGEKGEDNRVNEGHEQGVSKMLAKTKGLNGGADGVRTHYLLTASQTLSQLSYSPIRSTE
jgi:hypothetical protein